MRWILTLATCLIQYSDHPCSSNEPSDPFVIGHGALVTMSFVRDTVIPYPRAKDLTSSTVASPQILRSASASSPLRWASSIHACFTRSQQQMQELRAVALNAVSWWVPGGALQRSSGAPGQVAAAHLDPRAPAHMPTPVGPPLGISSMARALSGGDQEAHLRSAWSASGACTVLCLKW